MVFTRLHRIYSANGGNKKPPISAQFSSQSNGSNSSATDLIANVDRAYRLPFGTRTRFVILVHLLLCLSAIWSNILSFNFAIICMIPPEHATGVHPINSSLSPTANQFSILISNLTAEFDNNTFPDHDEGVVYYSPVIPSLKLPRLKLTNYEEGILGVISFFECFGGIGRYTQKMWLTSIVAVGALVFYFPIVLIINRFQIRVIFAAVGLSSAIATGLIPIAITGIAIAANFPVIGAFNSKWAYHKQNGLFVSTLVAYVQFAPAVTNLISGPLCTYVSWQSVFYVHAAHSAVVFVLFGVFFRNSPGKHPLVGGVEVAKISRQKSTIAKAEARSIPLPLRDLFMSIPVWAAWIGGVGNFFAVNLMFLFTSVYLSRVLGFSTGETGITAAIPAIAEFFVKVFCGIISDRIHCISGINKLRCFNSLGLYGAAICLAVLAFLDTNSLRMVCMVMLMVATGILGCTAAGFFKCAQLISQQFSYIVTGAFSFILPGTMLLVPFLVNGLAPENQPLQWRWVFIVTAGVLVVTNTIFIVFCSAEPCKWTNDAFLRQRSTIFAAGSTIPELPPAGYDKNAEGDDELKATTIQFKNTTTVDNDDSDTL